MPFAQITQTWETLPSFTEEEAMSEVLESAESWLNTESLDSFHVARKPNGTFRVTVRFTSLTK